VSGLESRGGRTLTITLGNMRVGVADVSQVARHGARVELGSAARQRIVADRVVVDHLALGEKPIYGLTTGLGAAVDTRVPKADVGAFQTRAVMARSVAIGPRLAREIVRAAMFARIASMAVGGSGISPMVLDGLIAMLNAGVHPVVPAIGSIGAADLAPLAHLALPLLGMGEAEYQNVVMPGGEALSRAGIAPVTLGPKDGLALINSNAVAVGAGALVLCDVETAQHSLDISAALSLEGFRANLSPLDPRALAARPAPGQAVATARLCEILRGSDLHRAGAARRVQDPLSLRCIAPVHGAALHAIDEARGALEIELNGAGDNPLVVAQDNLMLSTANFDATSLTLTFELLGQALAHCAGLCCERTMKLLSPRFSDLPRFLAPLGPPHTGFATVQKTGTALDAEIRHLALPASLGARVVADGVEDHAGMLPLVVKKTDEILKRLRWLVAIEFMVAAQALDLRPARLGATLSKVYDAIRAIVPKLDQDRIIGPDIERIAGLVESGDLLGATR